MDKEQIRDILFKLNLNYVVSVRERTIPTERPQRISEISAKFFRIEGCSEVGAADPLLSFQVAPQLYSRGWVDPVPNPLLLRKSDSAGKRTRTSGSVARNSGH
jgi:hypothetical protein